MNKESPGSKLLPEIQRLKAEQNALRVKKKQVAKELKKRGEEEVTIEETCQAAKRQ